MQKQKGGPRLRPTPRKDAAATPVPQTATRAGLALWRSAMRWRRAIEAELSPLGLTLAQWLVLEATAGLTQETGDATSQAKVALRLEMDRMTVSQVMRLLEQRGLVDRAPDFMGPAYRIWVTAAGARLLEQGRPKFETSSARALRQC